jgi:hypothetical protein
MSPNCIHTAHITLVCTDCTPWRGLSEECVVQSNVIHRTLYRINSWGNYIPHHDYGLPVSALALRSHFHNNVDICIAWHLDQQSSSHHG